MRPASFCAPVKTQAPEAGLQSYKKNGKILTFVADWEQILLIRLSRGRNFGFLTACAERNFDPGAASSRTPQQNGATPYLYGGRMLRVYQQHSCRSKEYTIRVLRLNVYCCIFHRNKSLKKSCPRITRIYAKKISVISEQKKSDVAFYPQFSTKKSCPRITRITRISAKKISVIRVIRGQKKSV